jgi:hypothetical protein
MTTSVDGAADPAAVALSTITAALADLAAVPSWQVGEWALAATVAGLDAVMRLAAAQQVRLAAEADSRGLPGQAGATSLAAWLRCVVPAVSAREATTTAKRAERLFTSRLASELHSTRAALLSGDLPGAHADLIAATIERLTPPHCPAEVVDAETLARAQTLLVAEAPALDLVQLRKLTTHLRHRLDPDADDRLARDEAARARARTLTICTEGSGMVHLSGALTPQCGAALTAALDTWSAPLPAADGTPDPRTGAQRRHDALQRLAETTLAADLAPSNHGTPTRVVVRAGFETLAAALDPAMEHSGLAPATLGPDETPLSQLALSVLACDAEIVPVLTAANGDPLDVGDTQYPFPTKQRTAIIDRDRHCTYPRCTIPATWCKIHHRTWFSRGGRTSVVNAALLCGPHHRYVHARDLTSELVDGQVVWDVGPPPPGASPPSPDAAPRLTRATAAIDHLVRRWRARERR